MHRISGSNRDLIHLSACRILYFLYDGLLIWLLCHGDESVGFILYQLMKMNTTPTVCFECTLICEIQDTLQGSL